MSYTGKYGSATVSPVTLSRQTRSSVAVHWIVAAGRTSTVPDTLGTPGMSFERIGVAARAAPADGDGETTGISGLLSSSPDDPARPPPTAMRAPSPVLAIATKS